MKSFLKKFRKFSSLQKKNLQKLFTKIENKEMKNGHGCNIDTNRSVEIGGRTCNELNVKGSPFEVVNGSLNSFGNLNESQLKKTHRTICGGTNASCTIFVHRKVDEERKHAVNEFNHEGLRLASVMTVNGVVLKKTTQAFGNAISRFVKIKSKSFDGQICGVSMRNQNMAEEMQHPSFDCSHHIKIIHNGSCGSESPSDHDVGQIVVKDDNDNVAMNCKCLKHEINQDAKTFGDPFHQPEKCKRENSCMFNAIVNSCEKSFEKFGHKNLTHDALCDIVGKKEKKKDDAITLAEIKKFFEKHKLGPTVCDNVHNLVDEFAPEKHNEHISPRNFGVVVHDNHACLLNHQIKELEQKKKEVEHVECTLQAHDKCKFGSMDEEKSNCFKFIENLNDIASHIETVNDEWIKCFHCGDVRELLIEMIDVHKCEPRMFFQHNRTLSLSFRIGNKPCVVSHPDCDNVNDIITCDVNENDCENFVKADDDFHQKIVKKEHMSIFNDEASRMNEAHPEGPAVGRPSDDAVGNGIDVNKCHTWASKSISRIPIFHHFDDHVEHDDHSVEDLAMCVAMSSDGVEAHNVLSPERCNRACGFELKQTNESGHDALHCIGPSNVAAVEFSKAVDELCETELGTINADKFTRDKITGQLEKKCNHESVCEICKNLNEANHHKKSFGGEIDPISDDPFSLVRTTEKLARETFKPIKDVTHDLVSIEMFDSCDKCSSAGLHPMAVETDCVIVRDEVDEIEPHFDFDKDIGGVKLEEKTKVMDQHFIPLENEVVEPETIDIDKIDIVNEWNAEEITNAFDKHDGTLVNASLPGSGKSCSVKKCKGKKILFVAPFNESCQNVRESGHDAITCHGSFSLDIHNNECEHMRKFDISPCDVMCFDEVYMCSLHQLSKIKLFVDKHVDKKFIATGDLAQLDPIENECLFNNIKDLDV
eukprot:jgi/Bigna1/144381/aug1.87_g19089